MSMDTDPLTWKSAFEYLWAILLIPLKVLWNKADNACSKQDLKDTIAAFNKTVDEQRENVRLLFANAEQDRQECRTQFTELQRELHNTHLKVLDKMDDLRKEMKR